MGWKYEVNVWDHSMGEPYYWLQIYDGDSIIKAVSKMIWAKTNGWKCIKLEWRPE